MPVMRYTATFEVHGQKVKATYEPTRQLPGLGPYEPVTAEVTCETCSLSLVTVKAIEFMLTHRVQAMNVDGAPIVRLC